jgi:hypothetical protein
VKTETHQIGVVKAREFLANNLEFERGTQGTNRPLSVRKINEYAVAMIKGDWRETHQGIAFDKKGHLSDGQHRLLAIVQVAEEGAVEGETVYPPIPKFSVKMQVTWGLEPEAFKVLDTGLVRSPRQILAMAGYANQTHVAACARLLYLFDNHDFKYWRGMKVDNNTILRVANESGIAEYLTICTTLTPIGFIASAATVGYYVCERALPEALHEQFIEGLKTGENLAKDSPVLVLRNYMIRSKGTPGNRRDASLHLALYVKCWNDFALGRRRSAVNWRSSEDFPKPVTASDNG